MGRSKSFGEFSRRMAVQAKDMTSRLEDRVRRAAIAADTAIVTTTPVDLGRAKGNWNVSLGAPDTSVTENVDPSGGDTIARGEEAIREWKSGDGEIFIANSLPYIMPLENGSSAQRPEGMTRHGIDAARRELKRK